MKRVIANFEAMLWPSQQCNQTIHTRETEKKQGKNPRRQKGKCTESTEC